MKTMWMVLAVVGVMAWSASWVSACETCGCKAKAAVTEVKGAAVAAEPAVKCVACPVGKDGAAKDAVKCPGTCKEGCCKGDVAKCDASTVAGCKAKAQAAGAKTCGAAKVCPAAKACGATAAPATEVKEEAKPAGDVK